MDLDEEEPTDSLEQIEWLMAQEEAEDEGEDIEPGPGVREPLKPRPGRGSGSVAISPPDPEEWS